MICGGKRDHLPVLHGPPTVWRELDMINRCLSITACTLVFSIMTLASAAGEEIGQIKILTGEVHIVRENVSQPAKTGDLLKQADTVVTGSESSVGITFIDNSRFSAGPNSRIELKRFRFNPTTHDGQFLTELQRGTLAIISGKIAKHSPDGMKVRTRRTILGVRGTKFLIKVEE